MTLTEYIESIGDQAFARRHNVTERCARSWRLKQRQPRPLKAMKIVADTDGLVTLAEIYAEAPKAANG
jgi:hypothetical protein